MENYKVLLVDDGTMDTVISVNGREYRFTDADRTSPDWFDYLSECAIEAYNMDAITEVR